MTKITPEVLELFVEKERAAFIASHPKSLALGRQADNYWLGGVPMHWMRDWASPVPLYAQHAQGSVIWDVDGNTYDDFCLGDTPAMYGHTNPQLVSALAQQLERGATFMLPTEDSVAVGALLSERFGLPFWQMTTTATDANRAVIRWVREITGRDKILFFDGSYHGAVDDSFVCLGESGTQMMPSLVGQAYDMTQHSRVIPFNDLDALEAALTPGDVAAVMAEPAMTNCGMILPGPGFHEELRMLTEKSGTLLILDETHTISTGPGGYTKVFGLKPDIITLGKPIAGGIPAAVWGMSKEVADRIRAAQERVKPGYSGIGTTLSGNALAVAGMRAMLEHVMTPAAYAHMNAMTRRLVEKIEGVISRHEMPWSMVHIGARVELVLARPAPRKASEMRAILCDPILNALHLGLINRGILIAPFHMMMLLSPVTTSIQVDRLAEALDDIVATLKSITL